jgi:cytoskeletal protein CcmA (bactofilin family)
VASTQTLIPHRARVAGRIETDGDVIVLGRVEGSIVSGGVVIITPTGVAVAEIGATRADVQGVVIGNIVGTERIDVASGARVVGDLRAPEVQIAADATIEGRVDRLGAMAGEAPPIAANRPTLRARGPRIARPVKPEHRPEATLPEARPPMREAPSQPPLPLPPPPAPPPVAAMGATASTPPSTTPSSAVPATPRPPQRAKLVPRRKKAGDP